jgi:hypothetical protein
MAFSQLHDRVAVLPHLPSLGDLAGPEAAAINVPHDVLRRDELSADRKRTILSAWASDAYAVENFPVLRHLPGTPFPVTFSSIKDALDQLDRETLGGFVPIAARQRERRV